jgi:MscS family membrane protein
MFPKSRQSGSACAWPWGVAALSVLLVAAASIHLAAQIPGLPVTSPSPPPAPVDPLGRTSPRGTIAGLISAVHRNDLVAAVAYLELSARQRRDAETLATNLTAILDRYFDQPISSLSGSESGTAGDGLPIDRERIRFAVDGRPVEIDLIRVADPQAGLVWLISSATLDDVPTIRLRIEGTWIDRVMPHALAGRSLFGLSLALWLVLAASVAVPLAVFWLVSGIAVHVVRRSLGVTSGRQLFDSWVAGLRWPLGVALAVLAHGLLLPLLGVSLSFRLRYVNYVLVALVIVAAWLMWRLLSMSLLHARMMAMRHGRSSTQSLVLLADRIVKVLIVLATVFALVTIAGVDTTTALAGLGIGGVAVALGAQKSIENLLGAVFLLTDKALGVGDTCSIGGRIGQIEDITLRSVRLRTQEQSLLSVPAGVLAQASIENFATRTKTLMQHTLRLRYGTSSAQLQTIVARVQAFLASHPQLETATARFRLMDFAANSIDLELFAYVNTGDGATFLAIREGILLEVAAIVDAAGSGFARPTEFLQVEAERTAVGPTDPPLATRSGRLS